MNDTNTKTYNFTLTRDYVSSWGVWEAIREVLQNAIDNDNGYTIDLLQDTLLITNPHTKLSINTLLLGFGTKSDDSSKVGGFGEGSLLSMLVLIRMGLKVQVINQDEIWTPEFIYSEEFGQEVLSVTVEHTSNSSTDFTYKISGLSLQQLDELKTKSLQVNNFIGTKIRKTINTEYGDLILDERYKGMFYVEGLFIQEDDSFNFGYSFKSDYVSLDRDRKAINYYELIRLTSDVLLSQTEDLSIVETSINNKYTDIKELIEYGRSVPDEFAVNYADYFIDKHNIDEETFVGTKKETLVSKQPKTFVTDPIQAKIVNVGLNKYEEYKKIKNDVLAKDNIDNAYSYYYNSTLYKLHIWLVNNCSKLSSKQIHEFIRLTDDYSPSSYRLIKKDVIDNLELSIKGNKRSYITIEGGVNND